MSKPFRSIDEQIELLGCRGMIIDDDEVARHALEEGVSPFVYGD